MSLWLNAFAEETVTGLAALKVPEGFTVEIAGPPEMSSYPMFMTFDHKGRLFIAESSGKNTKGKDTPKYPECMILMLEDTDHDGVFDKRTVFADKLSLPMGVLWYRGAIYCASPPDFFRFEDTDGDGVADKKEVLLTGWNVLNTASLHGPFLGPDGYMYLTHGRHGYDITSKEGVHYEGMASRIWRCKPDGTQLERFAGGGFDNPIELVWTDSGDMIGTMTYFTDPMNGQRDALMHWVEGGVYPKMEASTAEFIRTGDLMPVLTKFARIAPSGLMAYRSASFGQEFHGNLFSAQFNPHRVQRHVLTSHGSTGASYACADSDFLTSSDPDFHPTDVVEDADGSILVSDTGGWYVDACPVSRVSKPEVRGAIYRIRKTDAAKVDDSWGASLNWENPTLDDLMTRLGDTRLRVREHALERVVLEATNDDSKIGPLAASFEKAATRTGMLGDALLDIPDENGDTRAKMVENWNRTSGLASALGQIGSANARAALLKTGLGPRLPTLRQITAHLLGVCGTQESVASLVPLLTDIFPGVRREAASSLGRLRAKEAAAPLLRACTADNDRFVEHAIIYALIQIDHQDALLQALTVENWIARKAALIALDQLKSDKLTADHAIAFLNADSEDLRKTGLWIASRHPEWSGSVLALLDEKVNAEDFAPEDADPIRDVLLAYAKDAAVQEFMARVAGDESAPAARRVFMFDTIEKANIEPLPDGIVQAVGNSLQSADETIRYRAATLMGTRKLAQFDEQLFAIADNTGETPALRLSALGTVQARHPELTDPRYAFLLENLADAADPALRLSASRALGAAKLSGPQLETLAKEYLPKADALTFASLLEAFKNGSSESVGQSLVASLSTATISPNMIPGGLDALLASYPEPVKVAAAPLRAQVEAEDKARLEKLAEIEPLIGNGDVGRGRQIFFNEKMACFTCHAVGQEGGTLGPDLTTIGAIRSGHDLLEAILFPNASFVPGYDSYLITAKDPDYGGTVDFLGVIGEDTADAILLRQNAKESIRIVRSDIESMAIAPNSIMPQGLDTGMSQEQLIDLLAFLQSLNNEQWLLPERRETAAAK
ncbi:MAG: PVC-type heme-binding CxxCH protein [Candidatus Hydrogenedentes bacterium]|nr:PVC-type heme-binding CxxCH protein [Candidatus Hydrogenedentota bacterium]